MNAVRTGQATRQLCTFWLDGYYLGIDVARVQEIIRHQDMTRVPLAPQAVHGLMNLRGQIVTAVDLRPRLLLRDKEPDALQLHVVIRSGDNVVSVLADEIGDVLEVQEDLFEQPPDTLSSPFRSHILGVYKLRERLLLVLDVDRALDFSSSVADELAA